MPRPRELAVEELRSYCNPEDFKFQTTAELEPLVGIVGQYRASQAMGFGLALAKHGYNIFVAGVTGSGRASYTQAAVLRQAASKPVPDDWCYVYNFKNVNQPQALNLPAGTGCQFCDDMQVLVEDLLAVIPKAFEGDDYEKQKSALIKEFQAKSAALIEKLNEIAAEKGFTLKRTGPGLATVPVIDGKAINPEEYEKLDQSTREDLERGSADIQLKGLEIMRRIQLTERETKEKINDLESRIALFAIGPLFDELREKYGMFPKVTRHLDDAQKDVLANLETFREEDEEQSTFPRMHRTVQNALVKYKVNLLVDHRETKGAPVVIESNPTYCNLVGRIDHENEWGMMVTDFTMIKPGALLKANGGYLVAHAEDVLSSPGAWEALKRVLKTREVRIENIGEQFGLIAMATLKPEPIPVK